MKRSKKKILLLPVIWFILIHISEAQVSAEQLSDAVQSQACGAIKDELAKTNLVSEEMQFNAAVCYYRNGEITTAYELFQHVHQKNGDRWKGAAFWEAKCLVIFGKDSTAVELLKILPAGFLNMRMLSQKEFTGLELRNSVFADLKYSLQPGFNIWTMLLGIIAITGMVISILLLSGKASFTTGSKWMALLIISFSFILMSYISIWTGYAFYFPYLRNIWAFLTLVIGPALLFYMKTVFQEDYRRKDVYVHFAIPFLSFLLTIPAILGDFGIQIRFPADIIALASSPGILMCQLLFYSVRIYDLKKNDWQVDTNIRTWTRILIRGMVVYTIAFISYFILVNASFFNPQWDYAISLVMATGILTIAYMSLVQHRVFTSEPIEIFLPAQKYQSSSLTKEASESIRKKLERLMDEQQVFKENELRLDDLAAYLEITRHQLSQVINEHYGINFFELINRYRVEYVKNVLADPDYTGYTIIQIAYEAGFNNKVSFNRYFKKEIGITPSAYRIKVGGVE